MPILEAIDPAAPLDQGDLLFGLKLYSTGIDWETSGGSAAGAPVPCLIISRPCNVVNKRELLVAKVGTYRERMERSADDADRIRKVLMDLRDGAGTPDRMYLGHLPNGESTRYQAMLDSLHTIQLPVLGELATFVSKNRRARLSDEARRDLHVRIFTAVARMGFDDFSWYSTLDLELLVRAYSHDEQKLRLAITEQQVLLAKGQAHGFDGGDGSLARTESIIRDKESKLAALHAASTPFEQELARRKGTTGA